MKEFSITADVIYWKDDLEKDKYLNVKDGIITGLTDKPAFQNVIVRENCAIFPGMINTHTHLPMVFFRGLADDLPLMDWLKNHIWPAEAKWLSNECVYDATLLAAAEMIKSGVTCSNDMYFYSDKIADAVCKAGLKAVIGVGVLDFPTRFAKNADECLSKTESYVEKYKDNELIDIAICPHAIYTVSPESYKKCVKFAEKYDVLLHTHLSESEWEIEESLKQYGKRPVELLNDCGVLDTKSIFAHMVYLSDEEIKLAGKNHTNISVCIESNHKLANGIAKIKELLEVGANVSVGTDGAASNNDLDIIGEISTIAKIHKGINKDATVLSAETVLKMATKNAAQALYNNQIGILSEGKAADFIVVSYKEPHMQPVYNHISHLVYSSKSSDVIDTYVNGKALMIDRKLLTLDEDEIFQKSKYWGNKISKG